MLRSIEAFSVNVKGEQGQEGNKNINSNEIVGKHTTLEVGEEPFDLLNIFIILL